MRESVALRRALSLVALAVTATVLSIGSATASPLDLVGEAIDFSGEDHCVSEVLGQESDGELILEEPRCYGAFALAVSDASEGTVTIPLRTEAKSVFTDMRLQEMLVPFTLGIHYTGNNGTGSSIQIKGNGCTGGYWNTGSLWANRIRSSYNGCYILRHYDHANKSGAVGITSGAGVIRNLPSAMVNRTESVSYHG